MIVTFIYIAAGVIFLERPKGATISLTPKALSMDDNLEGQELRFLLTRRSLQFLAFCVPEKLLS